MPKFSVKWIIDGEMTVEASDTEHAERLVQELLVVTMTDTDRWPEELGAQGIQGVASPVDGQAGG
jgi:hypothetical protein